MSSYSSIEPEKPRRAWSVSRTIAAVAACLLVSCVAVVSFLPNKDKRLLHTQGRFHLWGHLLSFSVIAFAVASVGRSSRARVLLLCGVVLLGFGIEMMEHLVFGGMLEWKDIGMDAIGAVLGTLAATFVVPNLAEEDPQ